MLWPLRHGTLLAAYLALRHFIVATIKMSFMIYIEADQQISFVKFHIDVLSILVMGHDQNLRKSCVNINSRLTICGNREFRE